MVGLGGRSYVTRCHDCRRRKIKCDAKQPTCKRCENDGINCSGYKRSIEFVHFDGKRKHHDTGDVHSPTTRQRTSQEKSHGELKPREAPKRILNRNQTILNTWNKSLSVPQYKAGFLFVLQERYLPDMGVVTSDLGQGICSSWIGEACRLSYLPGSGRLSDALMAMALGLVGGDEGNIDLYATSVQHYSRALNGLRAGFGSGSLDTLDQYQLDLSLITCLLCSMYEMMANKDYATQFKHLQGVRAMLKARGAENLQSPASRRTFYEYRAIELPVCLTTRKVSYLSLPEWIDPTWKSLEPNSCSHMQTLIDPAFQLPVLMERFDKIQDEQRQNSLDINEGVKGLAQLKKDALAIQKAIEKWDTRTHGRDKMVQQFIVRPLASLDHDIPPAYTFTYTFPHFEVAAALLYAEMIKIFLFQLIIDMTCCARRLAIENLGLFPDTDIREYREKAVESADNICQSTDYFLVDHKHMVGKMMVLNPFQAARTLLCNLSQTSTGHLAEDELLKLKADYCDGIRDRLKTEGLPVWDGMRLSSGSSTPEVS